MSAAPPAGASSAPHYKLWLVLGNELSSYRTYLGDSDFTNAREHGTTPYEIKSFKHFQVYAKVIHLLESDDKQRKVVNLCIAPAGLKFEKEEKKPSSAEAATRRVSAPPATPSSETIASPALKQFGAASPYAPRPALGSSSHSANSPTPAEIRASLARHSNRATFTGFGQATASVPAAASSGTPPYNPFEGVMSHVGKAIQVSKEEQAKRNMEKILGLKRQAQHLEAQNARLFNSSTKPKNDASPPKFGETSQPQSPFARCTPSKPATGFAPFASPPSYTNASSPARTQGQVPQAGVSASPVQGTSAVIDPSPFAKFANFIAPPPATSSMGSYRESTPTSPKQSRDVSSPLSKLADMLAPAPPAAVLEQYKESRPVETATAASPAVDNKQAKFDDLKSQLDKFVSNFNDSLADVFGGGERLSAEKQEEDSEADLAKAKRETKPVEAATQSPSPKPAQLAKHRATCDVCSKWITGIRHKCLECPDW